MDMAGLEYVGFWPRVWASVIDTVLVLMIVIPIMLAIMGEAYLVDQRFIKGPIGFLVEWILPAIGVVAFWIARGATPGKMAIGARIVDATSGGPASSRQLIVRYLGYYVSILGAMAGLVWVAFDERKQGWHDKLANTVVVRSKRS